MSQARPLALVGGRWHKSGNPTCNSSLLIPRVKDPMAASDDCGHIRFFSFSLIEGYISLVMDVQTQQRWAGPCVDIAGGLGGSGHFLPKLFL